MTSDRDGHGLTAGEVSVVVIGAGYAGVMATNRLLASMSPADQARVRLTPRRPVSSPW